MSTERTRRRRRREATAPQGPPPVVTGPAPAAPVPAPAPPAPPAADADGKAGKAAAKRRPREGPADRGLRDLVGAGRSLLGVDGALRGRDVNRPTEEDIAEAEREVVVVRRHWKPRAED